MPTYRTELRRRAIARDGCVCRYCGVPLAMPPADREPTPAERAAAPTVDHWVPESRGGSRKALANAVIACGPCNRDKGHLTGPEYMAVLAYRRATGTAETALAAA